MTRKLSETKCLAEHLSEIQIAARRCEALFGCIDELIEVGGEQALDVTIRLSEVGRAIAHDANNGLDGAALAKFGVE